QHSPFYTVFGISESQSLSLLFGFVQPLVRFFEELVKIRISIADGNSDADGEGDFIVFCPAASEGSADRAGPLPQKILPGEAGKKQDEFIASDPGGHILGAGVS